MGILNTAACLLLSAAPQSEPGPVATPIPTDRPVLQFAHLFAPDTTALFVLNPLHEQWTELKNTGLGRIFAQSDWLDPLAAKMRTDLQDFETRTGISAEQWREVLQHGIAVGWAGFDATGDPRVAGVVGLGTAETTFREALRQWAQELQDESASSARAEMWNDTEVWEIRRGFALVFAVRDSMLLLGSSRELVEGMLRRSTGEEASTLAGEAGFKTFVDECEKRPVWGCYLRPARLMRQLAQQVPDHQAAFLNAIRSLRIDSMERMTIATHIDDGELVERLRFGFPVPQEGLIGALMGRTDRIGENLARWVPEGATSFGFTALDFGEIAREGIALLNEVAPEAGAMAVAGLDQMYERLGVDLQEDLLATMGDHFASMQWPGPAGKTRMAMVFALRDDLRFLNAWDKLRGAFPIQPVTGNQTGQRLYRISLPMGPQANTLSAAVYAGFLFVTDSDEALQELLERDEALPTARVREFLEGLDPATTVASRTDLTAMLRSFWPTMQAAMGSAGVELDPTLADHFGVLRTVGQRDDEGYTLESRSPVGGFQGAMVVSIVSAIALPQLIAEREQADTPTHDTLAIVARLQAIHSAQAEFRTAGLNDEDGDGNGEYGTLDELLAAGMMNADLLGKVDTDGTVTSDEFLTTVLLPPTADSREQHFVAIAWPAAGQPGPVFCVLPRQPVLVNEILAGTAGMTSVDPRDVFLGGLFGNELTAGWRRVEPEVTRTARSMDDGSPIQVLRAVEQSGDPQDADKVLPLLRSEDPEIASRAAWLLGQIKAKDAVPQLCDVVKESFDDEVRRHAMAALMRLGDRRSLQTSVAALHDTDMTVRSLAAANLGKIRSREAVPHLLGLLDERAGSGEEETHDIVATLLALHDIGDTEALLPAASAFTTANTETTTALTFLFQELSPRLSPEEEASILLAVLDHPEVMLRRYAIQRLGELQLPNTARALEGRLAAEDEALQPLVRVSLAAVRGESMQDRDWLQRAEQFAERFWNKAQARWQQMDENERMMVLAGAGSVLLLVIVLLWARGRSRRKQRADKVAAMVAPSEGFEDDAGATDYEYGEGEEYYEGEGYYEEEPADTYHR